MTTNKIVLITGTSRGIGNFLARFYMSQGFSVIGCSRKPPKDAIESSSGSYFHYDLDITDYDALKKMFKDIRKKFGRLDCLINGAGMASMNHSLLTPPQTVESILSLNTSAVFNVTTLAVRLMKNNERSRIINFSTVAVPLNLDGEAIYAASKGAVENLTRIFAKEFSAWNITVNAVGPNPVMTDLIKNLPPQKLEDLKKKQAINKLGTFEDVLNVVNFFLSDKSDMITGQIVYLGGVF